MALNSQTKQTLACLVAILSCFGYYLLLQPALSGPFLFDDFPNLGHLALLGSDIRTNLGDYLAAFEGNPGRPLSALSFLLNDTAWPSYAYGFKQTNVLIHIINGLLLFGLLQRLQKAAPDLPQHIAWPLLAMAAWLFHPMQISAQMLVVQRMTLLAGTFSLAGLWVYVALLQAARNWHGILLALSALALATVLAVLCKESGALLPLYALVLQATLLAPLIAGKSDGSRRLVLYGCAVPALIVVTLVLQMGLKPDAFLHREFGLQERLYTQCHVILDYLREILFPSLTGSGIYHDDFPIAKSLLSPHSTFLIALLILVTIGLALWKKKSHPLAAFAVLWFFAGHVMESTVLPLELYFEHRNYLPLMGPVLAVTALPFLLKARSQIAFLFLAIWIVLLATITALQAPIWGQPAKMVTFWIVEHPKSLRATQELAKFYYDTADPQASVDVMMHAYEKERIRSADLPLTSLLTSCWQKTVKYRNVDLLAESLDAIPQSPFSNGSLVVLQKLNAEVLQGSCDKIINKADWWRISDALLANPKFRRAGEEFIRVERAKFKINEKDLEGTMRELEAAYSAHPNIELSYKIAETLISAGLLDEAKIWLERGLKLRTPWFKDWLGSDRERSELLLNALHSAEQLQKTGSPRNAKPGATN